MKTKGDRYCIIEEGGGAITVKFSVDKNIMAGADFQLVESKKNLTKDHWKMSATDGETVSKRLMEEPVDLHLNLLNWEALACSKAPSASNGIITVNLYQGGKLLSLTIPAEYDLDYIPPCKLSQTADFSGDLTFILKKKPEAPKF